MTHELDLVSEQTTPSTEYKIGEMVWVIFYHINEYCTIRCKVVVNIPNHILLVKLITTGMTTSCDRENVFRSHTAALMTLLEIGEIKAIKSL